MSKTIRNAFVVPMNKRNKSAVFHDRREERQGAKNPQLDYLDEYEEDKEFDYKDAG